MVLWHAAITCTWLSKFLVQSVFITLCLCIDVLLGTIHVCKWGERAAHISIGIYLSTFTLYSALRFSSWKSIADLRCCDFDIFFQAWSVCISSDLNTPSNLTRYECKKRLNQKHGPSSDLSCIKRNWCLPLNVSFCLQLKQMYKQSTWPWLIVARVTAREERIKRAKDNLNCFSAVSADSNTIKTFPPRKNRWSWKSSQKI